MLDGLHQQCDASGGRLVQRFIKQRNLDRCVVDIRNHRASLQNQQQQQQQQAASSALDPRQVITPLKTLNPKCTPPLVHPGPTAGETPSQNPQPQIHTPSSFLDLHRHPAIKWGGCFFQPKSLSAETGRGSRRPPP